MKSAARQPRVPVAEVAGGEGSQFLAFPGSLYNKYAPFWQVGFWSTDHDGNETWAQKMSRF
jgi:hypothetical protein